jgi:hypothetical protein
LIFYEIFFFTLTLFSFNIIYAQAWQTVGSHGLGNVADIIEYNGNIYIVGDIDEIGGVVMKHVAMWDGISKKLRFLLCASSF